jgi:hypothetical protein
MKIKHVKLAIIIFVAIAVSIVPIIFFSRSPVLIVTEELFTDFYGEQRIRSETIRSSLALFRLVKTVVVANDAGSDIISLAVSENSARPYCVIFPLRFARAARIYREQNPQIPVVILEGRFSAREPSFDFGINDDNSGFFVYKTDIENDFYRVGILAAAIARASRNAAVNNNSDENTDQPPPDPQQTARPAVASPQINRENEIIAVFLESNIHLQAREAFLRGINDHNTQQTAHSTGRNRQNEEIESGNENIPPSRPIETLFFTSFPQFSERRPLSCVVIAGVGVEYFERKDDVPAIFFTWLDPFFLPFDVAVVVNDSPWVQVVHAVRKVAAGETSGFIPSNFFIMDRKKFDRGTLRKIQKM